jgi:hypothetical protein
LLGETDGTGVCSEASGFAYVCRVARSDCVVSGGKNVEKVAVKRARASGLARRSVIVDKTLRCK